MEQLTSKQINTLSLILGIEDIARTHELDGKPIDCDDIKDIYHMLHESDEEDTIELFKEIIELSEMGYASINVTADDLKDGYFLGEVIDQLEVGLTEKGESMLIEYYSNNIEGINQQKKKQEIAEKIVLFWETKGEDAVFNKAIPLISLGLGFASLIIK